LPPKTDQNGKGKLSLADVGIRAGPPLLSRQTWRGSRRTFVRL